MHGGNRRVWSDVVHPSEDDGALVDGWVVALARNRQAELGDFSVSPAHQKNIMEFHVMFPAVRSLTIGRTNYWWHPSEVRSAVPCPATIIPVVPLCRGAVLVSFSPPPPSPTTSRPAVMCGCS